MTFLRQALSATHRHELEKASAIDPEVIAERGYRTLERSSREELARLGIGIYSDDSFPGLLLPMFRVTGEPISVQFKPRKAIPIKGKLVKYLSPRLQSNHLDVHPRNHSRIKDTGTALWMTEGLKKGDCLTSRGCCVITLTGVFNWRDKYGTLGDWEDVPLKGRVVYLCFDADARTNMNVARAMVRLGRWLKSKGAIVRFLIVPSEVNGKATKGADDYFAAGGTFEALVAGATTTEPETDTADGTFSDSLLAETIADEVLADHYVWCKALGWLAWKGRHWIRVTEETVGEAVRRYVLRRFTRSVKGLEPNTRERWHSVLNAARQRAVLGLAKGIVERTAGEFDADPDLLNTPTGVVDLRTRQIHPHDPALLLTKITRGSYRAGYSNSDWERALEALPHEVRAWFQVRVGQAITGHPTPDGIIVILQGTGENGKSALTTDGILSALGDYAAPVSPKLIASGNDEHSTERADLRGQRFLIAEELTENRALNVTAIKQISDVSVIKARYVFKDNFTFVASHSLFLTTNYIPFVRETDHGTWRRLVLVVFPYTFRKQHEPLTGQTDRLGDPGLKGRIRGGKGGQHDAIVTWAVDGAERSYAGLPNLPAVVAANTREWRKQADRILRFWDEMLKPDRNACISTMDLLVAFNRWRSGEGEQPWSKESFHRAFRGHEETVGHHVVERRPRKLPQHISRPFGIGSSALPDRPCFYVGVRFRATDEISENASENREWSDRSGHSGTYPREADSKKVQTEFDQSDQECCKGGSLELRCQLCPQSPTYWRRATERAQ